MKKKMSYRKAASNGYVTGSLYGAARHRAGVGGRAKNSIRGGLAGAAAGTTYAAFKNSVNYFQGRSK